MISNLKYTMPNSSDISFLNKSFKKVNVFKTSFKYIQYFLSKTAILY